VQKCGACAVRAGVVAYGAEMRYAATPDVRPPFHATVQDRYHEHFFTPSLTPVVATIFRLFTMFFARLHDGTTPPRLSAAT